MSVAHGAESMLYLSPAHGLYIGPLPEIDTHRGGAACFVFGVERDVIVDDSAGKRHVGPVIYVPPGGRHRPDFRGGRPGVFYVEAGGIDCARVRARFGAYAQAQVTVLEEGAEWRTGFQRLFESCTLSDVSDTIDTLLAGLYDAILAPLDPRILDVLARVRAAPGDAMSLGALASESRLSASRLQHLLSGILGVPSRRLRLWLSLRHAVVRAMQGASLTVASADAGFADSAHFSNAFRDAFGIAPSSVFAARRMPCLLFDSVAFARPFPIFR